MTDKPITFLAVLLILLGMVTYASSIVLTGFQEGYPDSSITKTDIGDKSEAVLNTTRQTKGAFEELKASIEEGEIWEWPSQAANVAWSAVDFLWKLVDYGTGLMGDVFGDKYLGRFGLGWIADYLTGIIILVFVMVLILLATKVRM